MKSLKGKELGAVRTRSRITARGCIRFVQEAWFTPGHWAGMQLSSVRYFRGALVSIGWLAPAAEKLEDGRLPAGDRTLWPIPPGRPRNKKEVPLGRALVLAGGGRV